MANIAARMGRALETAGNMLFQVGMENMRAKIQAQRDENLQRFQGEQARLAREQSADQFAAQQETARLAREQQNDQFKTTSAEASRHNQAVERVQAADAENARRAREQSLANQGEQLRLQGMETTARMDTIAAQTNAAKLELERAKQLTDLTSQYVNEPDPAKRRTLAENIYAVGGKPMEGVDAMSDMDRFVASYTRAHPEATAAQATDIYIQTKVGKPNETILLAQQLVQDGMFPTEGAAIMAIKQLGGANQLSAKDLGLVAALVKAESTSQSNDPTRMRPGSPGYKTTAEMLDEASQAVLSLRKDTAAPAPRAANPGTAGNPAAAGLQGFTYDHLGRVVISNYADFQRVQDRPGLQWVIKGAEGDFAKFEGKDGTVPGQ